MKPLQCMLIAAFLLPFGWAALAGPTQFNYQGKLFGADGQPVNGMVQVAIKIYPEENGGEMLHEETIGQVAVNNGLCSFLWGSYGITNSLNFTNELWAELSVNGEVLRPRQVLVAVPYAMIARHAQDVPDGAITGAKIASASLNGGHFGSNIVISGVIAAHAFQGDGGGLTNISAAQIDGLTSGGNIWGSAPSNTFVAEANSGYVTDWDQDTLVTLPATPKIGDTLGVVGTGTGTWRILQQEGQYVLSSQNGLYIGVGVEVTNTSGRSFNSIAISSNGSHIVAADSADPWISQDGGASWGRPHLIQNRMHEWSRFTLSPDGAVLMAQGNYEDMDVNQMPQTKSGLFFSMNDGQHWHQVYTNSLFDDYISGFAVGNTGAVVYMMRNSMMSSSGETNVVLKCTDLSGVWTVAMESTNGPFTDLAISDDGSRLIVVSDDAGLSSVFMSSNHGITWSNAPLTNATRYSGVSCSADGRVVALTDESGVFALISTDFGLSWNQQSLPNNAYRKVVVSGNGSLLFLVSSDQVHWTENYGLNWWPLNVPANSSSEGFAASSDGEIMVRPAGYGTVYVTTNGGRIWYEKLVDTNSWDYFRHILMSRGGEKVLVSRDLFGSMGDPYVFMSFDQGDTWSQPNLTKLFIGKVASSGDGSVILAVDMAENFLTSFDSGFSWTKLATNLIMVSYLEVNHSGSRFMALAMDGVFISDDQGRSWTNIFRGSFSSASMSEDGMIFFAYGDYSNMDDPMQNVRGLFSSHGSATNWFIVTEQSNLVNLISSPDSYVYGDFYLKASGDGLTITLSDRDGMGCDPPLLISTNGGANWFLGPTQYAIPTISINDDGNVNLFGQRFHRYDPASDLYHYIQEISLSTDQGLTWSKFDYAKSVYSFPSLSLSISGEGNKVVLYYPNQTYHDSTNTLKVIDLNRPGFPGSALEGVGSAKIQLIYVGNGAWDILSKTGEITAYY